MVAKRLVILAAALWAISALPGVADTRSAVQCLQNQLAALGHDPGAADGAVGPRTRRAFESLARAFDVTINQPLTPRSALLWCQRIGTWVPEMQEFWPSRQGGGLRIVQTDAVPERIRQNIEQNAASIRDSVARQMGVPLAGTDMLVVATNRRDLERLIRQSIDFTIIDLDGALRQHCDEARTFGAFTSMGIMAICVRSEGENWLETSAELRFVLAHEATHLVQFQLRGDPGRIRNPTEALNRHGPMWMIEGQAEVLGYLVGNGVSAERLREFSLSLIDSNQMPSLDTLEDRNALSTHQIDVYRVGRIAVAQLAEDHGIQATTRFFSLLGEGIGYAEAFEGAFGITPRGFHASFANTNRPVSASKPDP
ncbi:MAG: peptidoglycan-binding domain-containing protein [Paracoccaceae bacterium]